MKIYSSVILSKDLKEIPVFQSGKLSASKYNPENEGKLFTSTVEKSDFFVIFGFCAGFQIKNLIEKFPESSFLIVEYFEEDLDFIKNLKIFSQIKEKIIFCSKNDFSQKLKENYIPAKFSTISNLTLTAWKTENAEYFKILSEIFQKTLKEISVDFSTQAHFAKIWQKNILENLKLNDKSEEIEFDTKKTAFIIAAGPSLDANINLIKNNKNAFIISTDTGFKILSKNQIIPDVVLSIDGQNVSCEHAAQKINKNTIFVFDYCASSNFVKKIKQNQNKIIFSSSNHPLISYANLVNQNESSIKIEDSNGTVTIAALNFALFLGFSEIKILGADFSYKNQKPYAKGSYLDDIFLRNSYKLSTFETNFTKLMFRAKTFLNDEKNPTTEILSFYKESFVNLLKNKGLNFKYENNIYSIKNENAKVKKIQTFSFNFENFIKILNKNSENLIANPESFINSDLEVALLPMVSYYKMKNQNANFTELLVEAAKNLQRYLKSL